MRLRVIKQLLIWQGAGAVAAGLFGWGLGGATTGISALLGGLIAWLPGCYFAFRAFRHRGARAARRIVRSFYAGEVGKMALTMVMFTLVFIYVKPLNALALFGAYAAVLTLNWTVPLLIARAEHKTTSL